MKDKLSETTMSIHRRLVFAAIGLLLSFNLQARSLTEEDTVVTKRVDEQLSKIDSRTHLEIFSGFISKISYAGRYNGVSGIGLSPTIAFKHKSGFETTLANTLWAGYTPMFTQTEVNAGYSKSLLPWFGAGLSYAKTFMYYGTDSDKRAMDNALNVSLGLYLSWANIGVDYSYMFGYDNASALHIGMNKDFSFYKLCGSDKVTITPTIGADWAPETILYHYFSKNQVKKVNRGKGKGKSNSGGSTSTEQVGMQFQMLDYQFVLPINYRIQHFDFQMAFHLDVPLNLPPDYAYSSGPIFYISAYAKYIF